MRIETKSLNEVHGLVEGFSLQSPWPPLEEREMARRSTSVLRDFYASKCVSKKRKVALVAVIAQTSPLHLCCST